MVKVDNDKADKMEQFAARKWKQPITQQVMTAVFGVSIALWLERPSHSLLIQVVQGVFMAIGAAFFLFLIFIAVRHRLKNKSTHGD